MKKITYLRFILIIFVILVNLVSADSNSGYWYLSSIDKRVDGINCVGCWSFEGSCKGTFSEDNTNNRGIFQYSCSSKDGKTWKKFTGSYPIPPKILYPGEKLQAHLTASASGNFGGNGMGFGFYPYEVVDCCPAGPSPYKCQAADYYYYPSIDTFCIVPNKDETGSAPPNQDKVKLFASITRETGRDNSYVAYIYQWVPSGTSGSVKIDVPVFGLYTNDRRYLGLEGVYSDATDRWIGAYLCYLDPTSGKWSSPSFVYKKTSPGVKFSLKTGPVVPLGTKKVAYLLYWWDGSKWVKYSTNWYVKTYQ